MTRARSGRFAIRVGSSFVALLVLACVVALHGQQAGQTAPPPQTATARQPQIDRQRPPVTFKVEVNYVEVDAAALDRQGDPINDLRSDDFQVLEDGKPQKISTFSFVNIPVERVEKPLFSAQPIEPDVSTNARGLDGRIYLLVLDDLHTAAPRSERVRSAARRFVQQQLGANDLAAVVCTSGRTDAAQDFTSNQQLLLDAIGKFMGRKPRSPTLEKLDVYSRSYAVQQSTDKITDPLEAERAQNARAAFDDIRQLSDFLAGVHGRRKALVYISEGVDYNVNDSINNPYADDIRDAARDAIAAATRANVSIYPVDPRGLSSMGDDVMDIGVLPNDQSLGLGPESMMEEMRLSQDSLRVLADGTGGFAALNTNDFKNAFDRIVRENSSYYVLGYYSTNDRRDGKFRRIEVKVNRSGATVHFRQGYVAPSGRAPARRAIEHEAITAPEVREALESPVPMSGFTLSATAACFKSTPQAASVVVTIEGSGAGLKFVEKAGRFTDTIQAAVVAIDRNGKVVGGEQAQLPMALKPETRPVVQQLGFRILTRLNLAPGRYQLRIATRDTEGARVGSVYYDLTVPDFTKLPLAMSGIALTSRRSASVPTPKPDPDLAKMLPGPPTTTREFFTDDEVAALAEVYDNQASTAHKVDIETTVLAEGGRAVFRQADQRSTDELGGKNGGFGYVVRIPLRDIPPGLYVLKIVARSTLTKTPPVSREVQFTVRPAPGKAPSSGK